VPDLPEGYKGIPEEEQKKANVFFDRGKSVANAGQYEYAIEMYLSGLAIDPENTDAHQALREMSLKRKASGGKDLGMMKKMGLKRPTKDDKQNMLNAEQLLAYDPGNTDNMLSLLQSAHRAGFYDTVMWMGPMLQKANADSKHPEFNKFIILKDIYKDLQQWKLATDACHYAAMIKPDDMDLQTELKNLGAQHTMSKGNYGTAKSFRDSIKDMDKQSKLLEEDKDVRSVDYLRRAIAEAEAEWKAEPNEPGKLMKYVEALVRTEDPQFEARAMEVLNSAYEQTRQFRFRANVGKIKMAQLAREGRSLLAKVQANPADETLKEQYRAFARQRAETELEEYTLAADAYPTDISLRYQKAVRLFQLERYNDAIPVFQQARQDPKFRHDAAIALGRSFLESGFVDEAIDTLRGVIEEYQLKGDTRSKDMYYWYARALEQKGETAAALKSYSQVAQWDFNYRDVQVRIKRLRVAGSAPS
jgi:thioredoxin-like negative regulator of GroEL